MKIDRGQFLQHCVRPSFRDICFRALSLHPRGTVLPIQALPIDPRLDAVRSQPLQPYGTVLGQGAELTSTGHP